MARCAMCERIRSSESGSQALSQVRPLLPSIELRGSFAGTLASGLVEARGMLKPSDDLERTLFDVRRVERVDLNDV